MKKIDYFIKKYHWLIKEVLLLTLIVIISLLFLFNNAIKNPFYYFSADISELYFPWWIFISQKVNSFVFPFRNEYYLLGSSPFFPRGDPSLFYPIQLIFQIISFFTKNLNTAYFIFFIQQLFHYVLGAIFFYLLLRIGLKLKQFPSFLASLTYVLSGSFMARFVHPPLQYSLAWYPLLFLLYILFLEKKRVIYALLSSVIISFIILSGHSQIVYYFLSFFMISVIFFLILDKSKEKKYLIIVSIISIVWGFLLSAIQLIPSIEFTHYAQRISPETTIKNLYNSLHPLYYLTLIIPKLFGRHQLGYWGSEYPWGNWENFLYLGILPFLLIFYSPFWKYKKYLITFYLSLFSIIIMSLGKYWWLSAIFNQVIPFANSITFVSRISMVFHFFAVIIIGIGAEVFQNNISSRFKSIFIKVIYIFIGLFFCYILINNNFINYLKPNGSIAPSMTAFIMVIKNTQRSSIFFTVSALLMVFFVIKKKKIILVSLVFIFLLDVIPIGQDFNPIDISYSNPEVFFKTNVQINYMKRDNNIFRVLGLNPRNTSLVNNLQSVSGYSTITTKAYQKIIPFINQDYPNILNLSNVKYVISEVKPESDTLIKTDIPSLYINKSVLPRIFFVDNYKYFNNDDEITRELTRPNFDPTKLILLNKNDRISELNISNDLINNLAKVNLNIYSYKPDLIKVFINTKKDGFIFLSEVQYPGWLAIIDGKKKNLIPANLSFYALPIKKGEHTIYFKFFSKTYLLGAIISFTCWCVTLLLIIFPKIRGKFLKTYLSASTK